MQLRRVEKLLLLAAAAGGAALPIGSLDGEVSRLLITFLGLVAASVLPTVTLILGAMTSSGRSVKALDELRHESQAGMDALFLLLGCVGVAVVALLSLSLSPLAFLNVVPFFNDQVLPRVGQALTLMSSTLIVARAGIIPAILRRALNIRHGIAVEEARRKTMENAPGPSEIKKAFATHPDFGKSVDLRSIQSGEPH